MPKSLLIMRHAKSSWDDETLSDHDRPLNKRGLRDAPRMAQLIEKLGLVPDQILSSTANRAKTTALVFSENCNGCPAPDFLEDFYHAPPSVYLSTALQLSDEMNTVMFVGHNPGMEDLVSHYAGSYERMPTAAIALLIFEVNSWREIENSEAKVENVWRPKEI